MLKINNLCKLSVNNFIGGDESPTFDTSNSEEESKIKFYFLLPH